MTSTSAIADVQSRIQAIQNKIAGGLPNSGASFQAALTSALGTDQSSTSAVSSSGSSGDDVVADAKKYLGIPYVWGGTDPAKGLDCSGLVQTVFKDLGISMPRLADDQAKQGTPVASMAQAKPGDVLAFGSPVDHIGIYAGNNKMIIAPKSGDVVKMQDVYTTPSAIRRIVPDSTAVSAFSAVGSIGNGLSSQYNNLFQQAGAKYGISANVLAAVAKQESGFNPNARSGAGAQGLMQLMPATAKGLGVTNPLDPAQAVDGAAKMLSGLAKKFGSINLALAAYNAGPGAVQKYGGIPPYAETQKYVRNVLSMSQSGAGI